MVAAKPLPDGGGSVKNFYFLAAGATVYLDPITGYLDEFLLRSGPSFTGVTLPASVLGGVELLTWDEATETYVNTGTTIRGGEFYSFGSGVNRFRLVGLGQSPATIGLDFAGSGAVDLSWTSIAPDQSTPPTAVPEPNSLVLFGGALVGFAATRRKWKKITA